MSTHRTPDDRLAQMAASAADPHADWDTLHFIAENYPSLRPAVARNPGTYPELLEALGTMNDPEIDAALASRASQAPGAPEEASGVLEDPADAESPEEQTGELPPVAGAHETTAPEQPEGAGPAPAFLEEQMQSPDPEEEQTQHIAPVPPTHQPPELQQAEPQQAEPQQAEHQEPEHEQARPDQAAAAAYAQQVQTASAQPPRERGSRTPKVLAAVLLPVVGLIAVAVLVYFLLGDSGEQVAEEEPPAQQEPAAEEQEPSPEQADPAQQDEDDADPEADLEEARSELTALPDDSACQDPQEDSGVVAAFVDSAAQADAMDQEAGTLEDLFGDLQDSCDAVHAASVYEGVRSGGDEETADSFQTVGTDWSDPMMDADGAQEMDSFITPDQNMLCVFDDGLTCTVLEQGGSAPAGCEDGATFTMQVDGDTPGLDCDSALSADEDYETLAHDDTATDGFLACVSLDDRISCWNTLTGVGFEMSEGDHYAYSP